MTRKLAIVLGCSAAAGFLIAVSKPWWNDAAPAEERRLPGSATEQIPEGDWHFLSAALELGSTQLYLVDLAKNQAKTEELKAVGKVLWSAQTEENERLIELAAMKGVAISNPESTGKKALEMKFGVLSGPKFDKSLMEEIIRVNEETVATYEAAVNTRDDDIKAFIDEILPRVKEKLLLANRMSGNARRSDKIPAFRSEASVPQTR